MSANTSEGRSDKRKQSLYFPEEMHEEIISEAVRLDRSLSWIMQHAWLIARKEFKKIPSVDKALEERGATPPVKLPKPRVRKKSGTAKAKGQKETKGRAKAQKK